MIKKQLKKKVAEATVLLWEKGLSAGRDVGDTSFRDPETNLVYICPRPTSKIIIPNWGITQPKHIVVLDLYGKIIENTDILPTLEAPMHLSIYKSRPDINAIVHSHAIWSTVFAITGKNIPLVDAEMDEFLGGEVICAEYAEVATDELANNVIKALGKNKFAAIMRNHGAVCVGKDFEQAFTVSDFLEKSAKTIIFGHLLGKIISHSKIEYTPKRN